VARLSAEQYRADRGAFFKSVQGTLNHLPATDRIWMQRFTGVGDAPSRPDTILFETFDELRTARELEHRRIVDFVDGLDDARTRGRSNTAASPRPSNSSSNWPRRWCIGSITRPTTAGKSMRC